MTTLRWIASSEASALHAAAALAAGREIVDARLAQALAKPVSRLLQALQNAALLPADFFRHAIPLACRADKLDLAELTVEAARRATACELSETDRDAIVAVLGELFAAQDQAIPDMARQLTVRAAPLAEQWEARGPGLLAQIGCLTDRSLIPAEVDVALVYPACGGGGAASPSYNLVRIEAVLANPQAAIPEVVRLGWLISQLGFKTPESASPMSIDAFERCGHLAMVVPALQAAEHVELARLDESTLKLALDAWGLADEQAPELAGSLIGWWEQRRQSESRESFLDWMLSVKTVLW